MITLQNNILLCHGVFVIPNQFTTSRQFGKGFRDELLKSSINWRTRERRSSRRVNSRSNSSPSELYHSGGISSASGHSELSGKFSMRLSQGSKLSHDVTHAYTSLRPQTPRNGASGKFHSPALKQ